MPAEPPSLLAELRRTADAFRALAEPLTPAQLAWQPPSGGWSVAHVLEHLVLANGAYATALDRCLTRAIPGTGEVDWRPSWLGERFRRAVAPEATRRLPAPPSFRPPRALPAPRADALPEFLAIQARIAGQLERAGGADWVRTRFASPVSSLLRFNLGDAFAIVAAHTARHLGQARRIRAHERFPAA